jgi:lipopolysaccharide/colanic/teichoic acid biosynthesis glycosyltransferase
MLKFLSLTFKRFLDILISLLVLTLLSPAFLVIALRIRRDSPGPVIYKGIRLGRNGKPFKIFKFRTMHETAESYQGPAITAKDDARITLFGRWLRETKLNELPQFVNVLRGEMSIVGPRPENPELVEEWPPEIRQEILSVRPGITSPASVLFRDEEELLKGGRLMDTYLGTIAPTKLRLDQLYVRNRTTFLDLDVILWTFLVFVPSLADYQPPEGLLFWGPISKLFRRHFSWFMADTLVSLVAISLAGLFYRYFGPLDVGWLLAIVSALIFAFLFSITAMALGVNRVAWSNANGEDVLVLIAPTVIATVLALIVNNLLANPYQPDQPFIPNGMILLAALLAFLGFILVRLRERIFLSMTRSWLNRSSSLETSRERVLVIGGGESGQLASALLSTSSYAEHFKVVGYVDDNLYKQGTRIRGVEVVGKRQDIPQLVKEHDIGLILFAIHNITAKERRDLLSICDQTLAQTVLFPDIPAALDSLYARKNRMTTNLNGFQHPTNPKLDDQRPPPPHTHSSSLPCEICLIKMNPLQVDRWLAHLEEKAQAGDLEGLQADLQVLRSNLNPDVVAQIRANDEVE